MPADTVKHTPLLPCAHCGEVEHLYPAYRLDKDGKCIEPPYAIDCLGCGHDFTPRDGTDARAAWNRRAPDPVREKLVEALEAALSVHGDGYSWGPAARSAVAGARSEDHA